MHPFVETISIVGATVIAIAVGLMVLRLFFARDINMIVVAADTA